MLKPAAILACGLAVLAGCSTAPRDTAKKSRPPKDHPPDWESVPVEKPATPATASIPLPSIETSPPPEPAAAPEMKWLSLNRWSAARGFGTLRRLPVSPLESFAMSTTNGVFIVTAGSRTAYWDGLDFRLGFAAQLIEGQVFLHAVDLRKNFEPLLRSPVIPIGTERTIVIDPGHGGSNTGTRSVADGRLEKEFTLDWAFRLRELLATNGWRVLLTRTNDADVSLAARVACAERENADLFLSLHFNSAGNGHHEAAGLETYCLTPAGLGSTVTREFPDDVSAVFPNNAFDEQNLQFAARLHRALLHVDGNADRGVRRARFPGVLRGQRRPAVLIEGGYLSNLREARRIADPGYREQLARALAKALE